MAGAAITLEGRDFDPQSGNQTVEAQQHRQHFRKQKIQRRLKPDVIQLVLSDLVSNKKADWVDSKTKTEVWIWWRSAEEWATLILAWIDSTGQNGSIVTFYDIAGDDSPGVPEMVGMDSTMLHKVCQVLVHQGKAAVMRDEDGNEVGLKV